MRVIAYADVICPWCAVGDARFARGRALTPDTPVTLEWRAFQLNPHMPRQGMPREAYYVAKFGGRARAMEVYRAVAEAGATIGVGFAFEKITTTPNTLQAHRLIYRAQADGDARPMIEALYEAYFRGGRDIGDDATLAAIASEAGYDAAESARFLAGSAFREAVLADDRAARRMGVTGVPFFVFNGAYTLSGAQPPEAFARAIEAAALA